MPELAGVEEGTEAGGLTSSGGQAASKQRSPVILGVFSALSHVASHGIKKTPTNWTFLLVPNEKKKKKASNAP